MNRAKRKEAEREIRKMKKVADKLTPNQMKLFDIGVQEKVRETIIRYNWAVNASLLEHGIDYAKVEEIMSRANKIMEEEHKNEVEEFEMAEKITREMIIKSAKKYGLDKEGRKKIAKELGATYSTITNYISRWKIAEDDLKDKAARTKEEELLADCDPDIREGVEQIMEIIEENDISKEEEERANKIIEEAKAMQCTKLTDIVGQEQLERDRQALVKESSLKVLSMVMQGQNGKYIVCPEGLELQQDCSIISFESVESVDKWADEVKEVFRRYNGRNACI